MIPPSVGPTCRSGADGRRDDAHRPPAPLGRHGAGDHGHAETGDGSRAQALDTTGDHEHGERHGQPRERGADDEEHHASQVDATLTEAVTQAAVERHRDTEGEQVDRHQPAKRAGIDAEVGADRRQRDVDHGAAGHRHEARQADDSDDPSLVRPPVSGEVGLRLGHDLDRARGIVVSHSVSYDPVPCGESERQGTAWRADGAPNGAPVSTKRERNMPRGDPERSAPLLPGSKGGLAGTPTAAPRLPICLLYSGRLQRETA